jgi:hypothetical protein
VSDRFDVARSVADAVLYEGYVLYPYRASSRKNQVRFQWGVLTPKAFAEADGSERWWSRTECLLDLGDRPDHDDTEATLFVRVRCLQTQRRSVEAATGENRFAPVDRLEVDGTTHLPWDEATDRVVDLAPLPLNAAAGPVAVEHGFTLDGGTEEELVRDGGGTGVAGRFVRERLPVEGVVRVSTSNPAGHDGEAFVKVTVTVENTTAWDGLDLDGGARRDDATPRSLVAVHTMLSVDGATFVSLLDPPDPAVAAAADCHSDGAYPVLVGDEHTVLASPIILYDHPEVAPQSPGDLYDSLEIDEILALRVMTLTDEEKAEARGTDPRAAAIIDRCDRLSPESMSRLHGEMRPVGPQPEPQPEPSWLTLTTPGEGTAADVSPDAGLPEPGAPWWDPAADASVDPWHDSVEVDGVVLHNGSPVVLRPSGQADAQDMFLDGRRATVVGVFADVDGGFHVAVTLDDDPATAELVWQGRYLYFHTHEVEPVTESTEALR